MSAIQKALVEIKSTIPPQILAEVFQNHSPYQQYRQRLPASLDNSITNLVLKPRVLVDANLIGGVEALIDLSGLPISEPEPQQYVIAVPKERTQNRSIISALSVMYNTVPSAMPYSGYYNPTQSELLNAASAVLQAHAAIPITSSASVQLIGENTILITEPQLLPGVFKLRCILANDENLSNISPRNWLMFSKLCIYAVKAHIYNTLYITMDAAQLHAGYNIGAFKEIVAQYADAEELYQTQLREHFAPASFLNDRESTQRFIKMQTGSYR